MIPPSNQLYSKLPELLHQVGAIVGVGERGEVTVEVKSGPKKRRRNGRFELNNDDDGVDHDEVGSANETLSYNWAEMHGPKLLPASKG